MRRRTVLMLALGLLLAAAVRGENGVLFFDPIQYEMGGILDVEALAGMIGDGCGRLEIPAGNVTFMVDDLLDPTGISFTAFRDALPYHRTVHVFTHGSPDGQLMVEGYGDLLSRDFAMQVYVNHDRIPQEDLAAEDVPGSYGLWLTTTGIEHQLKPYLAADAILMVSACSSCAQAAFWSDHLGNGGSATMLCYQTYVDKATAAADLGTILGVMTCDGWAAGDTLWECQAWIAARVTLNDNLHLLGNPYNQWNPRVSCRDWDVSLERVAAWGDSVAWLAADEDPATQYVVLGRRPGGAPAETLAVVDGAGRDGRGRVRSYAVRVPAGFAAYQVDAVDGRLVVKPGEAVRPGPCPAHWPLPPGAERRLDGRGRSPGKAATPLPAAAVPAADPSARADVLIYSTTGAEALVAPVEQLLDATLAGDGRPWRRRTVLGAADPDSARAAYARTVAANAAFPDPERPYRAAPLLLLVGDPDTVGVTPALVASRGGCDEKYWRSYAVITDIDGDLVPDGPVAMLPVRRSAQAARHAAAVRQYLRGENVDPAGSVVCFLDDTITVTGAAGSWLADGLFGGMAADATAAGRLYRGLYRESEAGSVDDAKAAGSAVLNAGVGQVWYGGLATGQQHMTWFLRDDPAHWTAARHWLVFGPTCGSGATWREQWLFPPTIEDVMFHPQAAGVCVGGIGQINGSYTAQHMAMARILREEVAAAAPGDLVADVAWRVVRRLIAEQPVHARYALGITALGTVARVRHPVSTTAVPDTAVAVHPGARLAAASLGGGAVALRFRLPAPAPVTLSVFDLRGRRVARLLDGRELATGDHAVVWHDPRAASGVYLARLRAGGKVSVQRFVVVR